MNSSEHIANAAETNNQLLFPSIFKHAWGVFKQKWGTVFALSLIPLIFVAATNAILISTIYIVLKLAGDGDIFNTTASVFHYAPSYVSMAGMISAIITILGFIYFSLRSAIASIKVLESDSKMTVRHAWHGISFKSISSLLAVIVLFGIIMMGGYVLFFIPVLFLVTFYSNIVFTNVIEGKKGIDALVLSRQYVKGYGAIVFVNFLVIVGIGLVFGLLFKFAIGLAGLMILAVAFGKFSILSAAAIALGVIILATLIMVLWKSFAFVVVYTMFKKLQSLKAHHAPDLTRGRKTVKLWLIISIVAIAIFVGVTSALNNHGDESRINSNDAMKMYQGNSNFTDFNDNYPLGN